MEVVGHRPMLQLRHRERRTTHRTMPIMMHRVVAHVLSVMPIGLPTVISADFRRHMAEDVLVTWHVLMA